MKPTLIEIFGYPLHAYPVALSIAFVACTLLAVNEGEKRGVWLAPEMGIWVFVGAVFGAKLFFIIQYNPFAPEHGEVWHRHAWRALLLWQGGLVYYGGLIGGAASGYLYTVWRKLPPIKTADVVAPYLALGQGITRIGCFLNGCCHGTPCSVPWGVSFPKGSPAYERQILAGLLEPDAQASLPVHPTQLYMVFGVAAIFFALRFVLSRQRFSGQTALFYGLLYGALRFVVETCRGESARSVFPDSFFPMTVSQAISLALLVFSGVILLAAQRGRRERAKCETPPDS